MGSLARNRLGQAVADGLHRTARDYGRIAALDALRCGGRGYTVPSFNLRPPLVGAQSTDVTSARATTAQFPVSSRNTPTAPAFADTHSRANGGQGRAIYHDGGSTSARGAQQPSKLTTAEFDSPDPLQSGIEG